MSGRFQTHTVASEGAELDDNYQKMVADIEEQTQRSGWLFGRGAFDKGDLQYLRDFNNSLRYKEVEIEDKERELWERERARVEAEAAAAVAQQAAAAAAALTRRCSSGSALGASGGLRGPPGLLSTRPAPLLLPVKVKPAGSKQQQPTPRPLAMHPAPDELPPSCKRTRTDSAITAATTDLTPQLSTALATAVGVVAASAAVTAGELRSAKSESPPATAMNLTTAGAPVVTMPAADMGAVRPAAAAATAAAACQAETSYERDQRQVVEGARPHVAAFAVRGNGEVGQQGGRRAAGSSRSSSSGGGTAGGLATLLGGYGSDDGEGEEGEGEEEGPVGGGEGGGHQKAGSDECEGLRGGGSGGGGEARRDVKGGPAVSAPRGMGPKLPPPVELLSPEELLSDPRVIADGLLATRPKRQDMQGGDAWDSEESPASRSGSDLDV